MLFVSYHILPHSLFITNKQLINIEMEKEKMIIDNTIEATISSLENVKATINMLKIIRNMKKAILTIKMLFDCFGA